MNQIKNLLINIFIIVGGSLGGTVSVAFLMYWIGAALYISLRDPAYHLTEPMGESRECARGNAFAFLSILSGAVIGFVVGFIESLEFLRPLKDEEQKLAVRLPLK